MSAQPKNTSEVVHLPKQLILRLRRRFEDLDYDSDETAVCVGLHRLLIDVEGEAHGS